MQFKVRERSPDVDWLCGVASPGMKGLTLQPSRGRSPSRLKLESRLFIDWPERRADQARLKVGEFVNVKVTGSDTHDLWGRLAA